MSIVYEGCKDFGQSELQKWWKAWYIVLGDSELKENLGYIIVCMQAPHACTLNTSKKCLGVFRIQLKYGH